MATHPASIGARPDENLGRAWWMVAILFSLYVFSWIDRLILSMLVTPIKAHLALSDVQVKRSPPSGI